jgi:hypothetical protein
MALQNTFEYLFRTYDLNTEVTATRGGIISDLAATASEVRNGTLPDTAVNTISLPIASVRQVFIKNTHATANITVQWTPSGGAEVTIIKLGPGDGIALWIKNAAAVTRAITTLKLQGDVTGATYDTILGG